MERTTRRIILSIVTLVLVVVALGTTTFAWFTLSNIATVSDISGEVQAGEGLEIAFGDHSGARITTGYKTRLTASDWADVLNWENEDDEQPYVGFKFGAASTKDGINFYNLVEGANQVLNKTAITAPNTNGGYLEFSIHFRSRSEGNVYWTGYEFIEETPGKLFTPDIAYTQTPAEIASGTEIALPNGDTVNTFKPQAINGLRVGIFGDVTGNETTIVQRAEGTGNTANNAGIVAGQFSYLRKKNVVINWDKTDVEGNVVEGTVVEGNAQAGELTIGDVAIAQALTTLGEEGKVVVSLVAEVGNTGFYVGQVNVRVWIEGWDADTYDAIFSLPFAFNLTFEKKE